MTLPVNRGAYRATCPNCPLDTTCTTAGLAAKSMRMHSCERWHKLAAMAARVETQKTSSGVKRDCQHKIAQHQHGTYTAYTLDRCRCRPCRDANSAFNLKRNRAQAYGRYTGLVDAQPAREHLLHLRANGISNKQAAKLAGISNSTIGYIVYGRTERNNPPSARIRPDVAAKILAVQPGIQNMADGTRLNNIGTRRRLQALVCLGYSISRLGREIGITPSNMHKLMEADLVTARTARAVRELYNQIWGHPNDPTMWQDKGAATRARNYAKKHGWVSPLAWDDDTIDNPDAAPFTEPEKVKGSTTLAETNARKAAERIEDIEFLREGGVPAHEIAARLGLKNDNIGLRSLAKQMRSRGRDDLANWLERATRKKNTNQADYTGRTR